ncbi:serine/threonine-protein kinase [Rhizohabitans arisaemae]|uniref:serine/threonine-protein kinase n=1 Tax=Rhizohabitans arisaemae TaxID=2720610 RepID=UPI0024B1F012|nr:serine/threonine-protein kinase [Rhizohabitans arisaemae]
MLDTDRYRLDRVIGRGGMGELWEGVDTRLHRRVAVKLIGRDRLSEDAARRFRREARIMAQLRHPGIPAIYDFGRSRDDYFLVMELVDGWTLTHVLDLHERLPLSWAAMIGAQLCAVLSAVHARSVIHRDLKPGNLMIWPDGTLVVLDFGIATVLDSPEYSVITRSSDRPGTGNYMAPEQHRGAQVTASADLYAVGCVLYEMATGSRVFQSANLLTEINGHVEGEPRPLRETEPALPGEFDELVMALLAKDPRNRPGDAEEVFHRLIPWVRDLPALPGVIEGRLTPVHLHAAALTWGGWPPGAARTLLSPG